MAPASRRDRTETSLYVKPRWVPARILTLALRWAVIIVGVTFAQRPIGVLKRVRGVSVGAPCCRRWATCRRNASFGHNRGSHVDQWPIFSSRTPFFCVVKTIITNVAAASSLLVAVAVAVSNTVRPALNVKSDRRNVELSDFVCVYSPGRRRKKKANMIMSATAFSS